MTRRISPSMVVALLALFVALGGSSYAALSISSKQIKNNSVRSKDLRDNDIRGKDIRAGSVAGSDIGNDSLSGSDVNELTLGKVPGAASADRAATAASADTAGSAGRVGGLTLRKIDFRAPANTPFREILALGGLRLQASCSPLADPNVIAKTDTAGASIYSTVVDADPGSDQTDGDYEADFGPSDVLTLPSFAFDAETHQVVYRPATGGAVTVTAAADHDDDSCTFTGTATG